MTPNQLSVLVVEDNQADAELVVEGLEREQDVTVRVARNAGEAFDYLWTADDPGSRLPGLILLDLNLPTVSGLEMLSQLKRDNALRRIPVVVLTTSRSPTEINRSYDLGAAAVLNKPMRLNEHRESRRLGRWACVRVLRGSGRPVCG